MLCTEESNVRDRFYKWLDSVVFSKSGLVNYRNRFAKDNMTIEVTKNAQFKNAGFVPTGAGLVPFFVPNEGLKYTLFDVFPDSINEIPLTQNAQNDYLRISVVMMYRKWIKGAGIQEQLDDRAFRQGNPSTEVNTFPNQQL